MSRWAAFPELQGTGRRMQRQPQGAGPGGPCIVIVGQTAGTQGMSCRGGPAGSSPPWAQESCSLSWEQPRDDEQEVSRADIAALNSLSCPVTASVLPLPKRDPPLMTFSCSPESVFVLENTFPLCLPPPHCSAPGRYYLLLLSSIFLVPLGDARAGCGVFLNLTGRFWQGGFFLAVPSVPKGHCAPLPPALSHL